MNEQTTTIPTIGQAWPDPDEAWKLGAVPFSSVPIGAEIVCTANGGRWRKTSETTTVCTETDSAYQAGETAKFGAAEMVVLIDGSKRCARPERSPMPAGGCG